MMLRNSKIIIVVSFVLVLCLTMPFISSAVLAYAMDNHTHICHDEEHEDDCDGTRQCCTICQNLGYMKNRPAHYDAVSKFSTASAPALAILAICYDYHHIPYINLISLKVRLNN